jgi:hypothetical protein
LLLRCPDGCGEDITVNLDAAAGPAWRLHQTGSMISVSPSIWRQSGCLSHFTIRDNVIRWSGQTNNVYDSRPAPLIETRSEKVWYWLQARGRWLVGLWR